MTPIAYHRYLVMTDDGSPRVYCALQHPPDTLPSPMSALEWRAGDSFDLAAVLASLLIGVGFNAFVVMGYAPAAVVQNDQRNTVCTVLEREAADATGNAARGGRRSLSGAKVRLQLTVPASLSFGDSLRSADTTTLTRLVFAGASRQGCSRCTQAWRWCA